MPYIVNQKRPCGDPSCCGPVVAPSHVVVSSLAVGTLEEARASVDDRVADLFYRAQKPGDELPNAYFEFSTAARSLPESGGSVGPLPDGTTISVEPVEWWFIHREIQATRPQASDDTALRLWNAKHAREAA